MKNSLLHWAATLAVVGVMALPAMAGGGGGGGGGGRGGRGGGGAGGGGAGGGGAGGGGFGGGGGGGGRGGFNVTPEQQITNALTNLQTQLGMQAGDEWTVLSAKIEAVLKDLQKQAAGEQNPLMGGRGGRGGGRGGAAAPVDAANALAVARDDLSKAVLPPAGGGAAPTTPDADLKTKLTAVRDNVKKVEDQLKADREALLKVVTVRQEAILVTLGVLN